MKALSKKISAILTITICIFINGCNLLDAVDSSINNATASDLISEGNDKLSECDYSTALNRFERALEKDNSDDAIRGRAAAYAGLAGFNMISALNSIQNNLVAPNTSATIFQATKSITSFSNLKLAIQDMASLNSPTKEDLLFKSLITVIASTKFILEKYDTNLNSKLDNPDQINFTTNDSKTQKWEDLYSDLSSTSSIYSLEKAYIELTNALSGRGTSWTTLSPFNSVTNSGTYTQANYNIIVAVGDLGQKIKEANIKYNNSVNEFKAAIMALDGVD